MADTCRTGDTVSRLVLDLVLTEDEQVPCREPGVQEELVPEDNHLADQVDKVLPFAFNLLESLLSFSNSLGFYQFLEQAVAF